MTDGDGDDFSVPVVAGAPATDEIGIVVEADEALLSRLAIIGDQPLRDRAASFRQVHDELRIELESSDDPTPPGP